MENQWFLVLGESSCSQKAPGDFLSRKCYCCYNEQFLFLKYSFLLLPKRTLPHRSEHYHTRSVIMDLLLFFCLLLPNNWQCPSFFFLYRQPNMELRGNRRQGLNQINNHQVFVSTLPTSTFKHIGTWVSDCLAERKISSSIATFDSCYKINKTVSVGLLHAFTVFWLLHSTKVKHAILDILTYYSTKVYRRLRVTF